MTSSISLPQAAGQDPFAQRLADDGQQLARVTLATLQLNLGKMCNLACHHCHVEAGPQRTEIMTWPVMEKILDWFDKHQSEAGIEIVDLTGGAPEMNPHFRKLVEAFAARGVHVLDRCNLTILLEPQHQGLIEFMAGHKVEIVASLPCYLEDNVDAQRGTGVFGDSVEALRQLNAAGYGLADSPLRLDLVYNPVGYGLPPEQASLEQAYKKHLAEHFDIQFNRLWTITNMPIKRFEHQLRRDGQIDQYMEKLLGAHNASNVDNVMCRYLVSVGWQGSVYDCDFNQMLQMPVEGPTDVDELQCENDSRKLWDYSPGDLIDRRIATAAHCFGCTAGAGSSCTGALS
jgi:radical SAM/Cys-rich protein